LSCGKVVEPPPVYVVATPKRVWVGRRPYLRIADHQIEVEAGTAKHEWPGRSFGGDKNTKGDLQPKRTTPKKRGKMRSKKSLPPFVVALQKLVASSAKQKGWWEKKPNTVGVYADAEMSWTALAPYLVALRRAGFLIRILVRRKNAVAGALPVTLTRRFHERSEMEVFAVEPQQTLRQTAAAFCRKTSYKRAHTVLYLNTAVRP
jgi:hypothetical protein